MPVREKIEKQEKKVNLSDNAIKVLEKRYLRKDDDGNVIETPYQMFERVANHVAKAEDKFGTSALHKQKIRDAFLEIMLSTEYLPNSPTFTGAGTRLGQLSACFVLPIDDDMESILKTQLQMGMVHKSGGGTGFSFSRLRPVNDFVRSTGGVSCGPLGFMQMYNDTTEQIKQGGTRRGANMGILSVHHPDIVRFIEYKAQEGRLNNFNISVAATDKFMQAVLENKRYPLINPNGNKVVKKIRGRYVFNKIIKGAWKNGEPGIIFIDRINQFNPTPKLGLIESTNPCVTGNTLVATEKGLIPIKEIAKKYATGGIKILTDERTILANQKESLATLTKTKTKLSLNYISAAFAVGKKEVFKLITKSGYELKATAEHKLLTPRGWVEVKNLKINRDKIFLQAQEGYFNKNKKLPFVVYHGHNGRKYPLNLPQYWSKELGQVLGILVGDGWLRDEDKNCQVGFTFGRKDKKILNYIKPILNNFYGQDIKEVKRENDVYHLSYHSKYFVKFFKKLGINAWCSSDKRVPKTILTAPKNAVVGFLQGLFTTNGKVNFIANHSSYIRLTSKSLNLLKEVQIILLNLGIKSKIYNRSRQAKKVFPYINKKGQQKTHLTDGILFELKITSKSAIKFLEIINFIEKRHLTKIKVLDPEAGASGSTPPARRPGILNPLLARSLGSEKAFSLLSLRSPINKFHHKNFYQDKFVEKIKLIKKIGTDIVYDLTEPHTLSYITNGFLSLDCGEQPLLPYESCNLGSINLARLVKKGRVDYRRLEYIVRVAVRFMDNVIEINNYPFEKIKKMTQKTRKIGLGVMGFADMLLKLGIPYNSKRALRLAEKIMKFINEKALYYSQKLAEKRGAFPAYPDSVYARRKMAAPRNATRTTIAPTGTLSIIAHCSSGIEPIFAFVYKKNILDGDGILEINPYFLRVAKKRGFYSQELMKKVSSAGTIADFVEIPDDVKKVFVTARDITPKWHIKMQAAFQKYTDNAVSKTINFPNSATKKDIEKSYLLAYSLGCKGLTVYREGSRNVEVLTTISDKKKEKTEEVKNPPAIKIHPRKRPAVVTGYTYKIGTSYGNLYVTINEDEKGYPFEIFTHMGKAGGFFAAKAESISRLVSLALRSGVDIKEVIDQLKGIRDPSPTWGEEGLVLSLPDAIGKVLEKHVRQKAGQMELNIINNQNKADADQQKLINNGTYNPMDEINKANSSIADLGHAPACPECGSMLEMGEGCLKCPSCGFSRCG